MPAWSAFFPDLLLFVQGCPEPLLELELRRAAQEFFRRSRAWVEWLPEITTTTARSYGLTLPTDSMVVRLEQATLNGGEFPIQSFRSLAADPTLKPDQVPGVTSRDRITLWIAQTLPAGSKVQVQAQLCPAESAATMPDDQFAQHVDAILSGAKARLMKQPDKPYSNLQGAAIEQGLFEDAIGRQNARAYRGFTRQVPRMPFRGV